MGNFSKQVWYLNVMEQFDAFIEVLDAKVEKEEKQLEVRMKKNEIDNKMAEEIKLHNELTEYIAKLTRRKTELDRVCVMLKTRLTIADSDQEKLNIAKDTVQIAKEITGVRPIFSTPLTSAKGYVVAKDYNSLCKSRSFARHVSLSMYNYYCTMLIYARLLNLHKRKGQITYIEASFCKQVQNYPITQVQKLYLSGFGDTGFEGQPNIEFKMLKPNLTGSRSIPGYFGPLVANASAYFGYPCPAVAAQRLLEDIRVTENPNDTLDWKLQIDSTNVQDPSVPQPTVRCIGYQPATAMNSDAASVLYGAGLKLDSFPTNNESLPLNTALMDFISHCLTEIKDIALDVMPIACEGFVTQLITVRVEENLEGERLYSVFTPFKPERCYVGLAVGFKYRVDLKENVSDYLPYVVTQGVDAAATTIKVFYNKDYDFLNICDFVSSLCNDEIIFEKIVQKNFLHASI